MKSYGFLPAAVLLLCFVSFAQAADTSVGLDIARGDSDSMAYSLRVAQKYAPWFTSSLIDLTPGMEIGAYAWVDNKSNVDTVWGAYISPGLCLSLFTNSPIRPFIATNLGLAVNSADHMDDRDFGSHLLIRSRGSVGVSFGEDYRHTVQGSFTHYSTWGLSTPDDGYNTYGMSYSFAF